MVPHNVNAPPFTFERRSSWAVDKGNVDDQAISGSDWVKLIATRTLWDVIGEHDLESSQFLITQDGVYNYDLQAKITDLVNVRRVEIAIFKASSTDAHDDYWFTMDRKDVVPGEAEAHLGDMTQFDFYKGERYYLAVKLTPTDDQIECSGIVSGADDFTAWGASWSNPLHSGYRS